MMTLFLVSFVALLTAAGSGSAEEMAAATTVSLSGRVTNQTRYDIAFVSVRDGQPGIYLMREDGSHPTLLLAEDNALLFASSWSPNGKKIAFFAYGPDDEELLKKYQLAFHFPLYVMNANGSGRERLIDVSVLPMFAWSPDSQRLALVSGYEDPTRDDPRVQQGSQGFSTAIYVFDFQNQCLKRITPLGKNMSPSWSPDGRRIVYCGDDAIYVVDVNAPVHAPQRLTTARMRARSPSWSPRGNLIAFSAQELPPKDTPPAQARAMARAGELSEGVFLMRPDGSIERQIGTSQGYVAWSPDGRHVLVIRLSVTVLMDATTGTATELEKGAVDATFAPDSRSVVYRLLEAGGFNLYAVDLQGQNRKRLTDDPGDPMMFSLSPLHVSGVTGIEEEADLSVLPKSFALEQNYPNPFNSSTMIRFALPQSAEVDLALYNLVGQKVATLVEGTREAGTYTIRWDGRDAHGRELASSVYLYRLKAGSQEKTRRLLLVR